MRAPICITDRGHDAGVGCSGRPGSSESCCASNIIAADEKCPVKREAPCVKIGERLPSFFAPRRCDPGSHRYCFIALLDIPSRLAVGGVSGVVS